MDGFRTLAFALVLACPAWSQNGTYPDTDFRRPGRLEASTDSVSDAWFDALAYDEPGDGHLWVMGRDYKASFGPEGATFVPCLGSDSPRNYPVSMRLSAASVGGRVLELTPDATWHREGDVVVLDRGAVSVRYVLSLQGIEQTFVLRELPEREDLIVRVDVESDLVGRTHEEGGFLFENSRGGVRYGAATVLDGAGRSLDVSATLDDGAISIVVPASFLRTATLPVIVDPVIKTYVVNGGALDTYAGDVAIDATNSLYVHAYERAFSNSDRDVFAAVFDLQGNFQLPLSGWINITTDDWVDVSAANNALGQNFLITCVVRTGIHSIWGRILQLPTGTIGGAFRISDLFAPKCPEGLVGGDADGGDRYCVVFVEEQTPDTDYAIRYRLVRNDGLLLGAVQTIDGSANTNDFNIAVSKTTGHGTSFERRWNILWRRMYTFLDSDIHGAQVDSTGLLVTPGFLVNGSVINHLSPWVSAPMDSAEGGPRDFLAVYRGWENDSYHVYGSVFKEDRFQASYNLTELEADVIGQGFKDFSQYVSGVCTDGAMFVVSYSEAQIPEKGDVYVSSFLNLGDDLVVVEPHLQVSAGPETHANLHLASLHDAGLTDSRELVMAWMAWDDAHEDDTQGGIYRTPVGWESIGSVSCVGDPNSTGNAGTMRVLGSDLVNQNHVFFDVDNLPIWQWGYFLMSDSPAQIPVASGTLCLGAPQIRLTHLIQNSLAFGTIGVDVDLTAFPGAGAVAPGDTWIFQFWYRDGLTSNFSNAVRVGFQ